jgi:hypothetical protein
MMFRRQMNNMGENNQATTILEAKVYQEWDDDMIYARNSVYKRSTGRGQSVLNGNSWLLSPEI